MAYTPNVPQGNQTIAATQAPILTNFTFLQTAIGADHNFDITGSGSNCYHNKASMPNIVTPVALPTGTDGIFYVKGSAPKFTNAASVLLGGEYSLVNSYPGSSYYRTGSVALTSSASTFYTVPNDSMGSYWLVRPTGSAYAMGTWISVGGNVSVGSTGSSNTTVTGSGLNLQAAFGGSGTFSYTVQVNTP
jgi:hypothetical protein